MKKSLFIFLLIGVAFLPQVLAQNIARMRQDDNFSYLKLDTNRFKSWDESLKYLPFIQSSTLSFGGEWREQYQSYTHVNFGDVPDNFITENPHQIMHRIMLHANWEWSPKFRVFVQLNNTLRFLNDNPITSTLDQNALSFHQAFFEWNVKPNLVLRVGRQEYTWGLERLMALKEGPNTRQPYYGATLKWHYENQKIDAFIANPIRQNTGVFDDVRSSEVVAGSIWNHTFSTKRDFFDAYYFYMESSQRVYFLKNGLEARNTVGTRWYSEKKTFNYDVEMAAQWGHFNDLTIQAFLFVYDFNYEMKRHFFLGFSGNWVPGDVSNEDQQLNTFNTLYSRPPFGQTVSLNITNTLNISPYIRFSDNHKWMTTLRASLVQRASLRDGIFTPNMSALLPVLGRQIESNASGVANIFALDANYFANKHLTFQFELGFCKAGDYLKEAGPGKDVHYFATRAAYKF
ncbi:alginate export family protein [Aquirufa ecclesiirivi]